MVLIRFDLFQGSLRGQYVLDKVFDQLNLFEKDYFSVRYLDGTGQTVSLLLMLNIFEHVVIKVTLN